MVFIVGLCDNSIPIPGIDKSFRAYSTDMKRTTRLAEVGLHVGRLSGKAQFTWLCVNNGEATRDRSTGRRANHPTVLAPEVIIERHAELRISVVQKKTQVDTFVLSPHVHVAGLLTNPLVGWAVCAR